MRLTIVLLLCSFSLNCLYLVRDPRNKTEATQLQPPPVAVALVGFYPYQTKDVTPPGKAQSAPRQYESALLYNPRNQELLGVGRPVRELLAADSNHAVPSSRVKEFMDTYLKAVGPSGLKELQSFVAYENDQPRIRNLAAEYIIVGIHRPAFEESQMPVLTVASTILTAFTFGLVPQVAAFRSSSTFLVYDKELNLVLKQEYSSDYLRLFALWTIPVRNDRGPQVAAVDKAPYAMAWDADVLDFRLKLIEFLRQSQSTPQS